MEPRLIYLGLLLVAVGGWLVVELRSRPGATFRAAMAWALIFGGAAAGYMLWTDFQRGQVASLARDGAEVISVPRAGDGHYYLTLTVGGVPITFMADTGATSVVLSQADARRVGIDPDDLRYDGIALTANGQVATANVTLREVALGSVTDATVPASVNRGAMDGSLLGMEYLGRFHIELAADRMILRR